MTNRAMQRGLTLVEVLVTIALLAIVIVPAVHSLHGGIIGARVHRDLADHHYRLRSRVETLLAEPFADLAAAAADAGGPGTPSSYSDPAGSVPRLLVFLAFYDGDDADGDGQPFTGADASLLWLRVEAEGTAWAIETLKSQGG